MHGFYHLHCFHRRSVSWYRHVLINTWGTYYVWFWSSSWWERISLLVLVSPPGQHTMTCVHRSSQLITRSKLFNPLIDKFAFVSLKMTFNYCTSSPLCGIAFAVVVRVSNIKRLWWYLSHLHQTQNASPDFVGKTDNITVCGTKLCMPQNTCKS